jgi:malonate decarboxylase alpha subunit
VLQAAMKPGDRVVVEGDNQKQADFLTRSLAKVDPGLVCELHGGIAVSRESP